MSDRQIRVATKKMMAHPKDEQYEDNYELHRCLHCKQEYLSQGIIEDEFDFCPLHIEFKRCVDCGASADKSEMTEVEEKEWYCSDCFVPCCSQCDSPVESKNKVGEFCSKQCYDDYWGGIMQDEYKDR
jgi:hypothetical protein